MITMKLMKKSPSIDQNKLKILCDDLCENIESLLDNFGLDYKINEKMISMACPIHGGDNVSAINLYHQGETYRGNWKCRTHNCEKIFKGSIIGFIRGVLSSQLLGWQKSGDDIVSFNEALDFVQKFLNKDINSIKVSRVTKDKQNFSYLINNLTQDKKKESFNFTREMVRKNLIIPSAYYISRNFTKEVLDKYDVGLCDKSGKEMSNRVVVPVYDYDHKYMIGCTGRSIYPKCELCDSYHNSSHNCPSEDNRWKYSKWKHSSNFKSQSILYNIWYAKEHIKTSGIVILVEGPGNVWRLEEAGIHNGVALFGCNLSDRQKVMLDSSGAMSIIILTDNDEAGKKAASAITTKCANTYRIYNPTIPKNDVGEMSISEIHEYISSFLEKIK